MIYSILESVSITIWKGSLQHLAIVKHLAIAKYWNILHVLETVLQNAGPVNVIRVLRRQGLATQVCIDI
jgi:ribosomal protein S7